MANKINPWAVCHSQLGKKKTDKFERCVMKIKTKHGIKDWTEFKAALRYLSETVQGQKEDILAARERQEKEKKEKSSTKPVKSLGVKEAIKSATSTGLVRGRIGKRPKGDEEEQAMRRQKGILAHTEYKGRSFSEDSVADDIIAVNLRKERERMQGTAAVRAIGKRSAAKRTDIGGPVHTKETIKALPAPSPKPGIRGSSPQGIMRQQRTAGTKYEGPSLKEKVKYLAEIARLAGPGPATDVRRRPGTSEKGRRARRRSSGETHKTPLELHMLKMTHPDTGVNAGTEHEGPSLREKLEYLKRSM